MWHMDINKLVDIIKRKFINSFTFKDVYQNILLLIKELHKHFDNDTFTIDIAIILIQNSDELNNNLKLLVNCDEQNKDLLIQKYFEINELATIINAYFIINNLDISDWLEIEQIESSNDYNELILKAKDGDLAARNKIVENNIGLVRFVIKKYENRLIISEYDDLLQEGIIELIKAIEGFDINKKTRFSTYAVMWIKQTILRYLANNEKTIRRPVWIELLIWQVQTAETILCNEKGTCTPLDIANYLNVSVTKVNNALKLIKEGLPTSLDKPLNNESEETLKDFIASDIDIESEIIDQTFDSNIFALVKEYLSDKEYEIICYRFGKYGRIYTLEELGLKYNLTRERIRQIEKKAIKKLSNPYFKNLLYFNDQAYGKVNLDIFKPSQPITYHLKECFYDYFTNYSKEEIDYAFKTLSKAQKNLVYQIYGQNLDEFNLVCNTKCIYFEQTIVNILKKTLFLNRVNNIKILEYFSDYSYDEIIFAINELINPYKNLVYYKYGQKLTNNIDLDYKKASMLFNKIFPLINNYLLLIHKLNNNSLCDIFSNITLEELKYFVTKLPLNDQILIYKTYGNNLNEKNYQVNNTMLLGRIINTLTDEINSLIFITLRKNIYEILNTNNQNEIIEAINRLNENDKKLFYARFSFDITNDYQKYLEFINNYLKDDFNELVTFIIPKIKRIIAKKDNGKSKTFYERFDSFTKEQVDTIFNTLTNADKEVIYFRFGPNLDTIYDYTNPLTRNKVEAIIQSMRKDLLKYYYTDIDPNNIKSLYDLLRISRENTKIIMNYLSDGEIEDLYTYFGFDLEKPKLLPLNRDFKTYIERVLFPKIRKLNKEPILDALKTYSTINTDISKDIFIIIYLKLGFYKSKKYSNYELSKLLEIDLEEIDRLISFSDEELHSIYSKIVEFKAKQKEIVKK